MHHEQSADDSDPRIHSHRPRWRRTAWRQQGMLRRLRARGHARRGFTMDPLVVPFVGDASEASLMASLGDCLLDVSKITVSGWPRIGTRPGKGSRLARRAMMGMVCSRPARSSGLAQQHLYGWSAQPPAGKARGSFVRRWESRERSG
jgi:hypothetical protein